MEILTRHNHRISLLIILFAFAISISSCRKDNEECCDPTNPECPNYDPCYGVEEPTAEIIMRELYLSSSGVFSQTPKDSVFVNEVEFSSPYTSGEVEHTWYLGAETINEASFSRTHTGVSRPAFITVSHVVEYPTDNECYLSSIGKDSTSATYYLIEFYDELLTYSSFRGAFENQTDSFDFKITSVYPDGSLVEFPADLSESPSIDAINFNNSGDTLSSEFSTFSYKGRNLISHLNGNGTISPQGTIMIDTLSRSEARLEYNFMGDSFIVNARILN